MYLLHAIAADSKILKVPAVYEELDDIAQSPEENIRLPRHPVQSVRSENHPFNFKSARQQDPQKLRYARQQQVDSYLRAYHQQLRLKESAPKESVPKESVPKEQRRTPKSRRVETHRENYGSRHVVDSLPTISDQYGHRKVVDAKTGQRAAPTGQSPKNSHRGSVTHLRQNVTRTKTEKVTKPPKSSYQVSEEPFDQEGQGSQKREARIYVGQTSDGFVPNGYVRV